MNLARLRSGVVTTVAVLAFTVVLSACGGESAPAPDETATPTATQEATPTPSVTSTATPASTTPTPTGAVLTLAIDSDTRWQDLFDDFTTSQQACIRDALGEELEAALGRLVLTDEDTQASEVALFSCLSPETARSVFLSSMAAGFEESEGRPLSADEASCLRERVADVDVAAFVAETANGPDTGTGTEEVMFGLVSCFPDLLLSAFLAEAGMTLDELSEEEASCLHEWSASTEWQRFLRDDDATVLAWLLPSLADCAPDLFLGFFLEASGITLDELGAEETSCLREWLAGLDWDALLMDDESVAAAVAAAGLASCLPSAAEPGSGADRGSILEGAVAAPVGVAIEGTLRHEGDVDVFVFEAEEGAYYHVDVTRRTLDSFVAVLYDADGRELASTGDLPAWGLFWEATYAGRHHVEVRGYGAGSYTLTVSRAPNDHADELDSATALTLGEPVEAWVNHGADSDVFAFDAAGGQLYEVDVALGSLPDSTVALHDAGGGLLLANDDYRESLASRLYWLAPADGGRHYVVVRGHGTGSYTLTVSRSPIDDTGEQDLTCSAGIAVPNPTANESLVRDCEHLLALRDALATTGSLNWSAKLPMTSWTGVTIADTRQRVTNLDLASSDLTGALSGRLGDLTALTELRLNGNRLTGMLPSKLGQLDLTRVYLGGNRFTGCLPSLLWGVTNSDVGTLGLPACPAPIDVSQGSKEPLTAGTYKFSWKKGDPPLIFDVPPGLTLELAGAVTAIPPRPGSKGPWVSGRALVFFVVGNDSRLIIDAAFAGVEWSRLIVEPAPGIGDLLDRVVEFSWTDETHE